MEQDSKKGEKSNEVLSDHQEEILLLLGNGPKPLAKIHETLDMDRGQVHREINALINLNLASKYETGTPPRVMVKATELGLKIWTDLRNTKDARKRADLVLYPQARDDDLSEERK